MLSNRYSTVMTLVCTTLVAHLELFFLSQAQDLKKLSHEFRMCHVEVVQSVICVHLRLYSTFNCDLFEKPIQTYSRQTCTFGYTYFSAFGKWLVYSY